ncbi:unnamed protein product [Paramecium pentaurelia]|uniref:Uncharacterized protein n=1 Tax=Paramecium pentaurelia TaxID=43138 RepID=A0A8S1RY39_9CILI|nr:unnamed protein product [Paramecium pentaurelia]
MNIIQFSHVKTESEDITKLTPSSTKTTQLLYPVQDDIMTPVQGKIKLKDSFNEFLDGRINTFQLLQAKNCPRLHQQQQIEQHEKQQRERESKGMVILGPLLRFKHKYKHVKTQSEERINYLKTKIAALNNLIKSKVVNRKKDNDEKRRRSLQNVGLLKSIVEASENINKKIEQVETYEKMVPQMKALKTVTISYDDQKLFRKQQLKSKLNTQTLTNPKLFLKTQLQDSSKQFLKELEQMNEKKQQNLDKLSRMKLLSDNKLQKTHKYDLFVKEVLTYKDIELYDYLHQQPQQVSYRCHFTNQGEETANINQPNSQKKPLKKNHKKYKTLTESNYQQILDVSDTSSLQSAYEIHLDNLYTQTIEVKKQLLKKSVLPKRIRQMIKLDELGKQTLHTSTHKLKH